VRSAPIASPRWARAGPVPRGAHRPQAASAMDRARAALAVLQALQVLPGRSGPRCRQTRERIPARQGRRQLADPRSNSFRGPMRIRPFRRRSS
jgi:hypothetical protein